MDRPSSGSAGDREFVGSIPDVYDRLLVPLLFREPAASLAVKVATRRPRQILETAAGTGVLSEALLEACPGAELLVTDLNQPMLDLAVRRVGSSGRVRFRQADALDLPVADASFDVVACQFGAMFFPDRVRGYRESLRVLRPGGALVFDVWNSLATNDVARVVMQSLREVAGAGALDFMARVPYGYHREDGIREDLARAGFGAVSVEPLEAVSTVTVEDAATGMCQGTPLRGEIEAHASVSLEEATRLVAEALRRELGNGEVRGRSSWLEVVAETA